jgi:hypothetical protein
MALPVEHRLAPGEPRSELAISGPERVHAPIRRPDWPVRQIQEHALHLPDVRPGQPPLVIAHQLAKVHDRVAGDAPREIDVRVDVAERKRTRRREHRLAAVESRVARTRDRPPAPTVLIGEEHMIEVVDRLEAEEQRRVAMRLEDDGGKQGGLETVRAPLADDAPEAAQGGPAARFLVVRQRIEVLLDGARRPQPGDQAPLPEREAGFGSRLQPAPPFTVSRGRRAPAPATSRCLCMPSPACRRRR